ncbi:Uncharacterized protein YwqG [Deinococcus reticulitermitis]|uniref:Uncharacterized protein YwqG n=1 Tax=Deinococcus reticulitermitis TaxID=856736 RepID=A0A1H6VBL9_9DEIO|nr:YwqG family protein [Deinococcus reticulitermitis]SEJ01961.1 Uncharacterized protein YwqG [Deinococcus reticulitermitis]
MTEPSSSVPQRQEWRHAVTGERATLTFEGGVTRLARGGAVREITPPPFDEAAEREETRAEFQTWPWNPFELRILREMARAGTLLDDGRPLRVEGLGFPARYWEELDAFERERAGPGAVSGTLPSEDTPADSLLWNPTPQMRQRFTELMAVMAENVQIAPPPADTPFYEQGRDLAQAGFVRISPRTPDGSLWLPPALEAERQRLEPWAWPVVRPLVVPGPGTPAPWDSKLGGVPYRPRGAAWPAQASGSPLSFVAQIDLAAANGQGHLPELPRRGLLQFFVAHSDASYEEMVADPGRGHPVARILYWPEVVRDAAALTREVPVFTDEFQAEMFNPPERALAFFDDREFPSGIDGRLGWLEEVAPDSGMTELHPNGHRLGGHAMVINAAFPPAEDWRLLFQFDGDDPGGQVYGGSGGLGGWIGFFVRAEDLARRDFSRVWVELDAF